jgi:hypothetical protein
VIAAIREFSVTAEVAADNINLERQAVEECTSPEI